MNWNSVKTQVFPFNKIRNKNINNRVAAILVHGGELSGEVRGMFGPWNIS